MLKNLYLKLLKYPRVLIFPSLVLVCLLGATFFKISGTSIGVYDYIFGVEVGNELIAGQPRSVRSDEWVVNTPFLVAQVKHGFEEIDADIGLGQDMTVVIDVPYKDWSILFRPQNLIFFVLPLEFAFAFKWWLLASLLLLAVYFFVLLLYPRRYLLASVLATLFFLSPFIQWWYQTITILPIVYSLFAVIIAHKLVLEKSWKRSAVWSVLLAYVLSCFTLVMYPAFQITAALIALAVFVAILYGNGNLKKLIEKKNLLMYGLVLTLTGLVVGSFLIQHWSVIETIQSTVYPGSRDVESGGFDPFILTTWVFSYLLLEGGPVTVFGSNQSEMSGFLYAGLVALPFLLLVTYGRWRRVFTLTERSIVIAILIILGIILCRLFIPIGDGFFSLLGLNKVPLIRLVIGLGLLNLIALAIVVGRKGEKFKSFQTALRDKAVYLFPLLFFGALCALWAVDRHYVLTSVGPKEIFAVSACLAVVISGIIHRVIVVRYIGLGALLLLSLISSVAVNPLYIGLKGLENNLVSGVERIERNDAGRWIANDNTMLSALLVTSGAEVIGGVNTYPQTDLWNKAFPGQEGVFNRYAHIRFNLLSDQSPAKLSLIQGDSFMVTVSSCDPLLNSLGVTYIVNDNPAIRSLPCFHEIETLIVGQKPVTIYKRS